MNFDEILKWLGQFVAALQNPSFLIFICAWTIGYVIKNTQIPIPSWLIPSVLAALGLCAGSMLLGAGPGGRFQGALTGMTLALAATGAHQIFAQLQARKNDACTYRLPPEPPPPPQCPTITRLP